MPKKQTENTKVEKKPTEKKVEKKTSEKKVGDSAKKKSSKASKGSVGFVYGGSLKVGRARLFVSSDAKPEETFNGLKTLYGNDLCGRYVVCENQDSHYEKLRSKLTDLNSGGELYSVHSNTLVNELKDVTSAKTAPRLGTSKPKKSKEVESSSSNSDEESGSSE